MCDPVTMGVLSFASSAASSVLGYMAQNEESETNERNATKQHQLDQQQLTLRQVQEQRAAAQQKQAQNIQQAEYVAEVEVAQSSKGVSGISTGNLVADVKRRAAMNRTTIRENTRMTVQNIQLEKDASGLRAQSRIDSVPKANPLTLIAGIGEGALKGYNTYQRYMG